MEAKALDLGLIFFPSFRSVAYLNAFESTGCYPSTIAVLKGSIPHYDAITSTAKALGYNDQYFNSNLTLAQFVAGKKIELIELEASSINDELVVQHLQNHTCQNWVFCGGGIVKKTVFDTGKSLIHIHPGILPDYRGSTTFYYSLIKDQYVGASAFFMKEEIDAGDVIAEGRYELNMKIDNSNALFMDYVLDPYVRAEVLKKVLLLLKEGPITNTRALDLLDQAAYYIIHPFLRHLAVKQLNERFDSNRATGVFEIA